MLVGTLCFEIHVKGIQQMAPRITHVSHTDQTHLIHDIVLLSVSRH